MSTLQVSYNSGFGRHLFFLTKSQFTEVLKWQIAPQLLSTFLVHVRAPMQVLISDSHYILNTLSHGYDVVPLQNPREME